MKPVSIVFLLSIIIIATGCKKRTENNTCNSNDFVNSFGSRNFAMGFTTWPFGPDYADRVSTYQFISANADIYSEQFDNYIPWKVLINNQPYPADLTNDIASRLSLRTPGHKLLLSVSLLNIQRDDLTADMDGTIPPYTTLDDSTIVNAYEKYLKYLVTQFQPDYLVLAMEANELRIKKEFKWAGYKALIQTVKARLKIIFPSLRMAESVTLHDWYNPAVPNADAYIGEITDYVNQQDFVAISFYPFLKGQHTKTQFQEAFDFLHTHANKPIAFVETAHIAENLSVPAFNLSVKGTECEQNEYLETLLTNARVHQYAFLIWWTHRDYDKLWQIFPDSTKDLGKLWRDTGLENETGQQRPAFRTWKSVLIK